MLDSTLVVTDLGLLDDRQRAFVQLCVLTGRHVAKEETRIFFGYDHVVYVKPPPPPLPRWAEPKGPREIDHQDIRSERPCT